MAQIVQKAEGVMKCKVCGAKRGDFEVFGEASKAKELRQRVQQENEKQAGNSGVFEKASSLIYSSKPGR